jgi:hypothetical protein
MAFDRCGGQHLLFSYRQCPYIVTLRQKVFLASTQPDQKRHVNAHVRVHTATFWPRRSDSPSRITRRASKRCCHQAALDQRRIVRGKVRLALRVRWLK